MPTSDERPLFDLSGVIAMTPEIFADFLHRYNDLEHLICQAAHIVVAIQPKL
jgi:hypothetical protein